MSDFRFDLQRFDSETVTISAGETFTADGITYTAGEDGAVLTTTDDKVTGISSGSVVAKLTDNDSSPAITFDGATAFDFACSAGTSILDVPYIRVERTGATINYTGGKVNHSAEKISGAGEVSVTGTMANILPFTVTFDIPDAGMEITLDGNTNVSAPETVNASLTFPESITTLLENLKPLIPVLLNVDQDTADKLYDVAVKLISNPITAELQGKHSWNQDEKRLTITDGSYLVMNLLDYSLNLAAQDGDVDGLNFFYQRTDDALNAGAKFTPSTDEKAQFQLNFTKDGTQLYNGLLNVAAGAVNVDVVNASVSVEKDTALTITQDDLSAEFTYNDAATVTYSADKDGLSHFTFGDGDGSVDITLNTPSGSISANVEVNGVLTVDTENQTVGMTKDTTTTITLGSNVISFTATDDAGITIVPSSDGKWTITPGKDDGSLDFTIKHGDSTLSGNLEISGGSVELDLAKRAVSVEAGTTATITQGKQVISITTTDDAGFSLSRDDDGKLIITPQEGGGSLNISVKYGDKTIFQNTVSINGALTFDLATQAVGFTAGSTITIVLDNRTIALTATDDASFTISQDADGKLLLTPADGDGSLDFTIKRADDSTVSGNLEVANGSIVLDTPNQSIGLLDDTIVNVTFGDYKVTVTAVGDATTALTVTEEGFTIKPTAGDGTLDISLSTTGGEISANLEILSGSLTLGNGNILVEKDTELQITFSEDYIIKFKATDEAGGKISLGADGITFTPNSDDGGLKLSVTQGSETRTASLDVNGSVTYKLDGAISLEKGTVVKNKFADGNILTIEAKTDASGSITFAPDDGLTINPSTPDALTATLTTGDLEVVKVTSIDGSITYKGGLLTASDGTTAHIFYYFGWESELRTKGGTSSVQFTTDRTVYIANEGANFVIDYLDRTTAEIQNGIYSDIYATETSDAIELVSEGSIFNTNDDEQIITLEKAGNYTLNGVDITTSQDNTQVVMTDYNTVTFAADAGVTVTASEDKGFRFGLVDSDGNIKVTSTESGDFGVSSGSITFGDKEFFISEGTVISLAKGEQTATLTVTKDISAPIKIEEDIYYLDFDDIIADVAVTQDEQTILTGEVEIDGVFSYRPETGTFGLTGANSSHGDGTNSFIQLTTNDGYELKMATNDTTVVFIPTLSDGKIAVNFPNERKDELLFTLSKDGNTAFEDQLTISGTVGFDISTRELSLTQGTVVTLVGDGENALTITALDDAGGQLTFTEGGIRFAPNAGDGQLELNFVATDRKANLDVSAGALIFGADRNISLEKDTVVNLQWEDGTALTLTASDTGGAIGFDSLGLKVSSDGELNIDLTTPTGVQTTLTELNGTIHYNAGKVLFDPDSTITATSTLGGQPVDLTLESEGSGGYVEISADGTRYVAGTDALTVTWSRDDLSSTFSINSGSVFIGHGVFQIAEGSDLSTDLKDLVPALYFTTTDAGEYTINGQTIETTAENISMTATDDYMTFVTSDDPVLYNGMNFAGAGNVSLSSSAGVVLGAGVEATGFGKDKMFVLAQAGNVTADARIFELTEDVPTGISVTGAEDGFIFSRVNTEESEARFDDPDPANVGKIFTEEFFLTNDDAYRIQTDLLGLQKIIGVTAPSTLNATATFDGEPERTVFDAVTDNEGVFTIGEKNYSISGDDEVAIKTIFNESLAAVRGFDSLSGTVAGDFTAHEVSINGSASAFRVYNDSLISISADEDGYEIKGLDPEDFLAPVATDTYIVNSTSINANAGDLIFGRSDGAQLFALNNDTIINGTESDDIIDNIGSNVSIYGHAGNDSLGNLGSGYVDGGAGDDTIDNYADDVTISGGAGNDSIENYGDNVYLSGGDGDDTIYNHGDDIIIDGGAGDDSISNNSANVTFIHSGGDDTIEGFNETSALQIDGDYSTAKSGSDVIVTAGEDKIVLAGAADLASVQIIGSEGSVIANIDNNTLITGTGGNDSILNIGDNVTIKAYGGDDTIDNYGEFAVISGSEGADSISNYSPENTLTANGVSINAGAGNDTIRNVHAYYVTLEGGAGDDHISVVIGNQTKIDGGSGNDTIVGEALPDSESNWAMGGYATINGGAGDDYIDPIFSDSASIMGGRGNDTIINEGDDATINGGAGDDLISLHGASLNNDVIKYEAWNGGNDSIFGFNETTQLSITAGTKYETQISGEDVLVTVGENVLTLAGAASLSTVNIVNYKVSALNISNTTDDTVITGTELADTIANSGANVTVSGRSGNDSITSSGALGSLNGGAGNDTLENSGAGATVEGYYGDDYLINSGDGVLVNGNYGNDTVINSGDNATLNPGSGFDSIVNTGANVLINFTGGTDSVWGFNETTSLQTGAGATSLRSGGDIVVTVGEDKITLVDAASVVAPNFDDGESIVLTKKGEQIVAGERVFELIQNVPTGVTLTGAQNGFTSAILTDDGELFVEEFTVEYDDSYNVSINGGGVQTVSGISAGADVTSNATSDGQETENQIYVVTDGAGSFLLNDMAITASDAATIRLRPQAMAFAAEGMTYDGKTFAGTGNVTVGADVVALGASVSAAGFEVGDEFILAQAGTATVDGRVFELTENISEGATISVERDGYTFSHTITQKELSKNNLPSDYLGKVYSENIIVSGDGDYSVRADSFGLKKVRGISDGATINGGDTSVDGDTDDKYAQGGQYLYIDTATEGTFTFGEKTYSISGDSNVELEADFNQIYAYVRGVQDLDGTISGNFDGDGFKVNGKKPILIEGDESISVVGTESGTQIHGVSDGASVVYAGGVKEIHTDTEGTFTFGEDDNTVAVTVQGDDNVNFKLNALQHIEDIADVQGDLILSYTSDNLLVNGIGGTFDGEFSSIGAYDGLYIHDVTDGSKFTTADADKIWLQMTGEHFTLNNNRLTLTNDADGIWIRDKEIVGLDTNASLQVTAAGNYIVNDTELKAKSGNVIIGESDGAHIYDARYPSLTKDTTRDELIEVFKPKNTYTPSDSASLTLEDGDLAIVDAAKVNISAGDGATVVNRGEDVNVSLTGGNTWLFAQDGSMNLTGYDHTTGTGFGTNKQNILTAVADGKIDFNRGRLTLDDAEVYFPENSALMNFFNLYGKQYKVGFASQGEALDVSNVADDLILVAKRNGSITSGTGDDTIWASADSFVDAGTGKNLVISDGANVSLSGRTTVTGTVDTIHAASPPAVDFTKDGLAFKHGTNSLLLADTFTTTRISMFYEEVDGLKNQLREAVYIADNEWYKVADGAVKYYVGATANKTHGLDFSGVSEPLNVTLNTDYLSTTAECWINNVHSIKGGDGLTTITGSERDDTILAGTGSTTINAGKGFDKLYGNTGANKNPATFVYAAGDGQDSIANFDFMSGRSDVTADKVQLDEESGVTDVMLRGDDVMIKVNDADGFLMLEGARGQSFQLNDDLIAKVDTDVAFDGFTNCYVGIGAQATLTVGKGMGDVEVWLSDDSLEYHGTMYDGNFKVLDASQSDGANILAGNELRNTIIGGAGDNSLWGGYGGENDLLIAGAGHNEYYYEVGNGHDTIAGANEGDVIHLGATLEQIDFDGTNMSADGITVKFTDGGQLDITGSSSVSFSFDDGTTVKANRQTQQFE